MKNCLLLIVLLQCLNCFAQADFKKQFDMLIKTEQQAQLKKSNGSSQTFSSNNFDINFYRCEWQIDPAIKFIQGKITSYFTITASTNTITYDLSKALTVDSVLYKGNKIAFTQTANNSLQIQFPTTINSQQKDSVSVYYKGIPVDEGLGSFVKEEHNGVPVMWTLSEPYGAKDWWPCKNGLDDKADSVDIIITLPQQYITSANGLLANESIANGKKTAYWKHRYPIATYLIAFAATNYIVTKDSVQIGATKMPVNLYSYPERGTEFDYATYIAKLCLVKFSTLYGEYPFIKESYSHTQFNWGGGIEHQTNSFIGTYWNQLVAHELGHQWFGDKVTCGSWQDVWLQEGFATYSQLMYIESFDTSLIIPYLQYCRDAVVAEPGGSMKVVDTTKIENIFSDRLSYYKGSTVVHMIRWILGEELFFKTIKQYLNEPAVKYGTAKTSDLQRVLEQATGKSFTTFFKQWYEGEGYPKYQVNWSVNNNNWIKVKIAQTTSHPSVSFYQMPVPIQFKSAGHDTTFVFNHTYSRQEFWINPGFIPDTVIFDPKIWLLSTNNVVTKISNNSTLPDDVKIYPNPAPTQVNVLWQNPSGKNIQIKIFNSIGQLLTSKNIPTNGKDELINISTLTLPGGIYILQAQNDKGIKITKKIIK